MVGRWVIGTINTRRFWLGFRVRLRRFLRALRRTRAGARNQPPSASVIRFPHWNSRFRAWMKEHMDWRGKLTVGLTAAFTVLILVPSMTALAVHRPDTDLARAWLHADDAQVQVRVYDMAAGRVHSVALNDYLVGVLAAEMSPKDSMQALEAAAVAARTYVVHAMTRSDSSADATFAAQHGADITTSASLDLPWWSMAEQEERYGADMGVNTVRLQHAVLDTDGMIVTANQQPILAFTFEQSVGRTRDGSQRFGKSLPYLPSVPCPDDTDTPHPPIPLSEDRLASALQIPKASLQLSSLQVVGRDAEGYVKSVQYKNRSWTGDAFAAAVGLPSANFTFTVQGQRLMVTCRGTGNGIGMSLHEARAMAAKGKSWAEILAYFYPGTKIEADDPYVAHLRSATTGPPRRGD
ncbi:hypothetical protein GCM10025857_23220 [Alicyclobacillus contaminans]|nr:hypothetical protein GCM10025857_23220 [Alicyclobacillus contaminans]